MSWSTCTWVKKDSRASREIFREIRGFQNIDVSRLRQSKEGIRSNVCLDAGPRDRYTTR